MIEKMKFVNIIGLAEDIDRVCIQYLSKYDFQVEDAVKELGNTKKISAFNTLNPLTDILADAQKYAAMAGAPEESAQLLSKDEAVSCIMQLKALLAEKIELQRQLNEKKEHLEIISKQIMPYIRLEFPIERLLAFSFIKYRFGRIPHASYNQLKTYLYDYPDVLFQESFEDQHYVWGIYFVPSTLYEKADMLFSSLHFERIRISGELKGTPEEAYQKIQEEIESLNQQISDLSKEKATIIQEKKKEISDARYSLNQYYLYQELQKKIALTRDGYFIIVGWMTGKEANKLETEVAQDQKIDIILEEETPDITSVTPTKLKNLAVFRPFEFFVKMYGLPSYNEIDPTPFFAVTYAILFGFMFGDFGQGLVLSLGGFIYYKKKKAPLGAILGLVGISSAVFGLLYGSIFGYEEILPALWMRPMDNMNDILITTVSFGIMLNFIAMVLQMVNAVKAKEYGELLFSPNGIAGLVFYAGVLACILLVYIGHIQISKTLVFILLVFPIGLIMFKEPLSNLLKKKKKLIYGKKGSFIMEAVFETFEILLSYVTNTISFVRVGAFALCHAGMMSVVLMLAGAGEHGGGNIVVMILGNLFVMALEGLVVAIQVLRLQYYEMFSRYFRGGGKAFKSYREHNFE